MHAALPETSTELLDQPLDEAAARTADVVAQLRRGLALLLPRP